MPVITTLADAIVLSPASGSDTVQGAVNAAQSSGLPLVVAGGVYTTTPLTISGSLTVRAAKGAALLRSSSGNALQVTVAASSGTISDVLFDGIVFDGENKPLASGVTGIVSFTQADRFVVENCFIFRSSGAGLYFNNCRGRVYSNGFDTCQTAIYSTNGYGVQIDSNNLYNSLNTGIFVDREPAGASALGYDATTISKNVITQTTNVGGGSGQYGNAILCYETQFVRVVDNIINTANYSAIRVNFCSDVVISGNQVDTTRETAIFVENPADFPPGWSNIVVSANTLNNVGAGITLINTNAGSRRASVVGNSIYLSKQNQFTEYATPDTNPASAYTRVTYGAGIIVSADCVVTSNVVEQTAGPGIVVALSGTYNTSSGSNPDQNTVTANVAYNTLKYCQIGIGYNDNDARGFAEISENVIVGASQAQIIKVQPTNLSGVPGNPNNQFGPFAIVPGSADQGATSNAITTRFSYNRNKIVPSTAS